MAETAPYYVLLDANVWVAERLLQSSIGSALLYALTGAKTRSQRVLGQGAPAERLRGGKATW